VAGKAPEELRGPQGGITPGAHRSPDRRGIGKNGRGPAGLSSAGRRHVALALALQQPPRLLLIPGVVGQRLRDRLPHLVSERLIVRLRGCCSSRHPRSRANREGAWAIDCSAEGTRSASTLVGTGQLATTAGDPHLRMGPACGSNCDDTARRREGPSGDGRSSRCRVSSTLRAQAAGCLERRTRDQAANMRAMAPVAVQRTGGHPDVRGPRLGSSPEIPLR
jgi:hypothetical protein